MHRSIIALISLALACHSALAAWPLHAQENSGNLRHKVWYGDGRAYTGPTVPDDVETAFNITVNGDRNELIVIEADTEANPESAESLADPTFVSLDFRRGAAEPVRFVHSALGLTREDIYFFANIDGFWYPSDRERILTDLTSGVFLVPTDVNETYALHWFDNADDAEEAGAIRVTLTMRGGDE